MSSKQPREVSPLLGPTLAALGAIVSSVGAVGFLIFVGGAVQVARDRGVGLAAPFAVSLVPRSQLLTSGADQLFAPFVFAMAAVGIAAVFIAVRRRFLRERFEPLVRWVVLLGAAGSAFYLFSSNTGDPMPAPLGKGDPQTAALAVILVLLAGVAVASRLVGSIPPVAPRLIGSRRNSWPRFAITRSGSPPHAPDRRILWFLAVVAVTSMAFSSLFVFALNEWQPQVRPVALLGTQYPKGLIGVDVGEDASDVYVGIISAPLSKIEAKKTVLAPLGRLHSKRLQARVIEIPRREITALSVGGLFNLTNLPKGQHTTGETKDEFSGRRQLVEAEEGMLQELQRSQLGPPK
jgi:hypothetical protein